MNNIDIGILANTALLLPIWEVPERQKPHPEFCIIRENPMHFVWVKPALTSLWQIVYAMTSPGFTCIHLVLDTRQHVDP